MLNHRRWIALLLCAIMTFSSVSVLAYNTSDINVPLSPQEAEAQEYDNPQDTNYLYYDAPSTEVEIVVPIIEEPVEPESEPESESEPELNIIFNNQALELAVEPLLQEGVTFVSLRAFCEAFDCTVTWNGSTTVVTRGNELKMTISNTGDLVEVNDRYFYMSHKPINVNGNLMVPIRTLSKVFTLETQWNEETKTIALTGGTVMAWGEDFYNANDLYWLSRIIHAESQGESLEGKIAVGNVILNRTKAEQFPNTIYDVIFDTKFGTQFTPTKTGRINNTPNDDSVLAAKLCLEGHVVVASALYFQNCEKSSSNWITRNRTFEVKIGCHSFYQ